ncbi:MAG TPA: CHASE3 domain-containing protein [Steroidobacteraceae bacterium]|nr:CHASE3 domain-containing protein [Steroidobacteraceae bacterium]
MRTEVSAARLPSRPALRILFVLSLAIVVLGTLVAWRARVSTDRAEAWVGHSREVMTDLESALLLIEDAETGQRGYLLTGDRNYLVPYTGAVGRVSVQLDALSRLTSDNPQQQRSLAILRRLSAEKLAELGQTIALWNGGEHAAALALVHSDRGLSLMQQIRAQIANMRAEEQQLLTERTRRASSSRRWGTVGVLSLGALALVLLALLGNLFQRERAVIFASEQRLRTIFASIGDGVIATDRAGRIERMNTVAEELTGWKLEEARGRLLEEVFRIVHEHTRAVVESPAARVLREGRVVGLANHTMLLARDGREFVLEDSAAPIRREDGELEGVVLVFQNATPRRLAERELAEREQQFQVLAENIPTLCWMADAAGQVVWYNSRWYEYTGMKPEAMRGSYWESLHDPKVLPSVLERWRAAIAEGSRFEMVFPLKGADGTFRPFLTRIAPVRDAEERTVGWIGTNIDISEQEAAQESLRQADRRKDEFLATLAHELRNPLAPVRNAVQLLKRKADDAQTREWATTIIERQAQSMARMLDDLLDVSRITRGTLTLHKQRLRLASVIDNAIEVAQPFITAHRHHLTVTLPPQAIEVEGDPLRLSQIVGNLLTNAAKYTDPGGRIELSARVAERVVTIAVKDSGIGLERESIGQLFEMFSQVKSALDRSEGGLGIGLALVKGLAELHGGSVEAQSAGLGEGSTFSVHLPLVEPHSSSADRQTSPAQAALVPIVRRRVLVADDNQDAATTLQMILELDGHEVHIAHDGQSALEAAERLRPQIAILDIGMPKLNGYEVARKMRATDWGRGIRLIALTGWGQEGDRRRAFAAGFDAHLTKPIDADELKEVLVLEAEAPSQAPPRTRTP